MGPVGQAWADAGVVSGAAAAVLARNRQAVVAAARVWESWFDG